jgi:hypothetical protein
VIPEVSAGNDADIWDSVGLPDSGKVAVLPSVAAILCYCRAARSMASRSYTP